MTKQNVIDLEAYREDHEQQPAAEPAPPPAMSEELKDAIESLIDKLRAQEPNNHE